MSTNEHIYRIVIAGARHRAYRTDDLAAEDDAIIRRLIDSRRAALGNILVVSMGCDSGAGAYAKAYCESQGIPFVEFRVVCSKHVPRLFYEVMYLARHTALVDIGEEFHIFVSPHRMSNIEDLVGRVKAQGLSYRLYGDFGAIMEQNGETVIRPI